MLINRLEFSVYRNAPEDCSSSLTLDRTWMAGAGRSLGLLLLAMILISPPAVADSINTTTTGCRVFPPLGPLGFNLPDAGSNQKLVWTGRCPKPGSLIRGLGVLQVVDAQGQILRQSNCLLMFGGGYQMGKDQDCERLLKEIASSPATDGPSYKQVVAEELAARQQGGGANGTPTRAAPPRTFAEELAAKQRAGEIIGNAPMDSPIQKAPLPPTPPAGGASRAGITAACGKDVIVRLDSPQTQTGMAELSGFEIVSDDPLRIKERSGTLFTTTVPGAGRAGETQWRNTDSAVSSDIAALLAGAESQLDMKRKWIASCSNACCDTASQYCAKMRDNSQRIVNWLQCVSQNLRQSGGSLAQGASSSRSGPAQIPNCPPTLPPSCVTWSLSDPQLHGWNLLNSCGKDASVTFRSDSGLTDTRVFGDGELQRVKWQGSNAPAYIVWDAMEAIRFYRSQPVGAALKCRASMGF
jgi:hypothetical protein